MADSSSTTRIRPLRPWTSAPGEGGASSSTSGEAAGRATRKSVPSFTLLSTEISPPAPGTMLRQMESPSPVPTPRGLVVKKGSEIRSSDSGGIPEPESRTSTSARPDGSVRVRTRISFSWA
jgi:hypothetical protein